MIFDQGNRRFFQRPVSTENRAGIGAILGHFAILVVIVKQRRDKKVLLELKGRPTLVNHFYYWLLNQAALMCPSLILGKIKHGG